MKKRRFLFSLIGMCMALSIMVFGVFAATPTTYTIGGNIYYVAPMVRSTISRGQFNGADVEGKMLQMQFTGEDQNPSNASTWTNIGDLYIPDSQSYATLTFRITNNNADKYIKVVLSVTQTSLTNATIELPSSPLYIDKYVANAVNPTNFVDITITFRVTNTTQDAAIVGFGITIAMQNIAEVYTVNVDTSSEYLNCLSYSADNGVSWHKLSEITSSGILADNIKFRQDESGHYTISAYADVVINGGGSNDAPIILNNYDNEINNVVPTIVGEQWSETLYSVGDISELYALTCNINIYITYSAPTHGGGSN